MAVSGKIASYKQENGMVVRDRRTEEEKLARQKEWIREDELRSYYVLFLQSLMDISSAYQAAQMEGMKIAYSGVEGA